jgi:glutamine synthetase
MSDAPQDADTLFRSLAKQSIRFVDLEFIDIIGTAKAVTVPTEQLPECLEDGRWFDGSSIESFARVFESDMYLQPDLATLAVIPWEPVRARVLCDVVQPDGLPFAGDSRAQLRRAIAHAVRLGLRFETAPEIEFFLLRPSPGDAAAIKPFDRGSYFDLVGEPTAQFQRELLDALHAMGVAVEASHHEVADGQFEIDLAMRDALATADAIMTAKLAIKAIAARHDLIATFLPKPITGVNGSGLHIHQRLVTIDGLENIFAGPDNLDYGLSETGLRFIAGLLAHAAGMSAILSPLVNSYKRLVPHYEAPVEINWGHHHQDVLVRVPRLSGRGGDVHIEIRSPDPSCNPYLALAALLEAGLDGIERQLDCPPPDTGINKRPGKLGRREARDTQLPESLADALDALEADPLMREALGTTICAEYLEAKWQEWESYRREVTSWELQRYLPLF